MNEAGVKSALVKRFDQQGWVTLRHEDKIRGGVPDLSTTGDVTVWMEVKTPGQPTTELQANTLIRLLTRSGRAVRLTVDPHHIAVPGTTKMSWLAILAVPSFLGNKAKGKSRYGWGQIYSCEGTRAQVLDYLAGMTKRLMELGIAGFNIGPIRED